MKQSKHRPFIYRIDFIFSVLARSGRSNWLCRYGLSCFGRTVMRSWMCWCCIAACRVTLSLNSCAGLESICPSAIETLFPSRWTLKDQLQNSSNMQNGAAYVYIKLICSEKSMCMRSLCDRVRKKMCLMLSMFMVFASQIESSME